MVRILPSPSQPAQIPGLFQSRSRSSQSLPVVYMPSPLVGSTLVSQARRTFCVLALPFGRRKELTAKLIIIPVSGTAVTWLPWTSALKVIVWQTGAVATVVSDAAPTGELARSPSGETASLLHPAASTAPVSRAV